MTDVSLEMLAIMVAWLTMVVITCRITLRSAQGSVGLCAAYAITTTFLYCGAFAYIVPEYTHLRGGAHWWFDKLELSETALLYGVMASLLGIAGFMVGCWIASHWGRKTVVGEGQP